MTNSGELQPLRQGLEPETKALAEALRALFVPLRISMRRYAARVHVDTSVVSRYLSGERVPDWQFVHELLVNSTAEHNAPPTQEVVSHLRALHRAVLAAGNAPHLQIIALREQLAEADAVTDRAVRRERDLEAALQAAQRQVAELLVTSRELTDAVDRQGAEHAAELEHYRGDAERDRRRLLIEIARLEAELEQAHERRRLAEQRVDALEQRLEQAELSGADWADVGSADARAADGLSRTDRHLLRLLADGLTDEAAATRLGISARTVRRIMADLMARLGAESRFEAGVQAAQRGWL